MKLTDSVTTLKGVGVEVAAKLENLGVRTIFDLVTNFPRKYVDYSEVTAVSKLRPGQVTLQAKIDHITGRYVRRGMHITEAIASDDSGSVRLVWFNQPYRAGAIKKDQQYFITGEYDLRRGRFSIVSPSVELVSDFPLNTARIVPIYRETKGLKSHTIRKLIYTALQNIEALPDPLPKWLLETQKLIIYSRAVTEMHFPSSAKALALAQRRLAFEEVFGLTLAALLNKSEMAHDEAIAVPFKKELAKQFVAGLPFELTDAQRKVIWRIYQDIAKTQPMNRLVEGDVGSGKTVVATMAALMAMEQGFQVAFMAPTEILARQHAETVHDLLQGVGFADQVGLLIGGLKPDQKRQAQARIKSGEIRLMVGTHALITEKVDMHRLGMIIVDEQHRFGVDQRKKLQAKAGHMPHVLHMTATPIPRSLALTLYGELDISILNQMPATRERVETRICSPNSRRQLYIEINQRLDEGEQLFVVCPLISESEAIPAQAAEKVYEQLSQHDFKQRRVGLLHGKLKSAEKEAVMTKFSSGQLDILVSTTVIEVGVHVPNASMMLIEGAERFGLAQIHQLRGRVGRGGKVGYCYLMPSSSQEPSTRLRALETVSDGFKLAELDLELRGPGAIYGTLQHGALDLRVAKLSDTKLIAAARGAAQQFIDQGENLLQYPQLAAHVARVRAVTNLN